MSKKKWVSVSETLTINTDKYNSIELSGKKITLVTSVYVTWLTYESDEEAAEAYKTIISMFP